jgi:DNA-binding transcriptional ArsR family regulator
VAIRTRSARTPIPPEAVVDEHEITISALRFLSDANRLRLVKCLAGQEACVFELSGHLNLPQPLVSYHLKRLREAGLVRSQRRAHRVYYDIDPAAWNSFTQPIREMCGIVQGVLDDATPAAGMRPDPDDRE